MIEKKVSRLKPNIILCLLEGDRGKAEVYLSLAQAGGSVPAGRALRFLQSK